MNRVCLVGRLTKDPELRYSQNGVAIASFTLAVDRNFKNSQGEKETDFIPCVAFRQLAEICANYLAKGNSAGVDGRIQVRSYENQDGQRRWVTEVVAENVQFLTPKGTTTNAGSSNFQNNMHEVNVDDEIPF